MGAEPNLLPTSMLAERSRRRRIRQWLAAATVESMLLTGACLLLRMESGDAVSGMDATIRSTVNQIDLMSEAIGQSRGELNELQRRLAITSEVDRQPDWSIVLAMVARKGGDAVRLESCQLLSGTPSSSGGIEYKFVIVGECISQTRLTEFAESLEATGAFHRLKTVETRRVAESRAVRFTIESWFVEGGA